MNFPSLSYEQFVATAVALSGSMLLAAEPDQKMDMEKLAKMPAGKFTTILDESTSPDKRLAVGIGSGETAAWELRKDEGAGDSPYAFLVDLKADRTKGLLIMRYPGPRGNYNHQSARVVWSPKSRWLAEMQNWKWHTGVCSIHHINEEVSIVGSLNLIPVGEEVVDDMLRELAPKVTKEQRANYAVRVGVEKIGDDGTLILTVWAEYPKAHDSVLVAVSGKAKAKIDVNKDGTLSIDTNKIKLTEAKTGY